MDIASIDLFDSNFAHGCTLSFKDPLRTNSYTIKNATGLDADEIISRYYPGQAGRSVKFYDRSIVKRDISLRIELNPKFEEGESYSNLRDRLYRVISASRSGIVALWFTNTVGELQMLTTGFITKFETSLFTKTPEVQITIRCHEPMLRGFFEEFIDNTINNNSKPDITVIDEKSTAPHGFRLELTALKDTPSLTITDNSGLWSMVVDPLGGFDAGDLVLISSVANAKSVRVIRAGENIELADKVASGSIFPVMFPGQNYYKAVNIDAWRWLNISYYATYWGV